MAGTHSIVGKEEMDGGGKEEQCVCTTILVVCSFCKGDKFPFTSSPKKMWLVDISDDDGEDDNSSNNS